MTYDNLDNALDLASSGFAVFPVWGVTDEGHCTCTDGETCTNPGKHPVSYGWQRASTRDADRIRDWEWRNRNIGVHAKDWFIVDCDSIQAEERFAEYCDEEDTNDRTYCVRTGKGIHFYYQDERLSGPKVGVSEGIDIRAGASYVLGPGSRHANGTWYEVVSPGVPIPAADWMYTWAKGRRSDGAEEYDNALARTEVGEGGRDNYLTSVAGVFRRRGAEEQELLAVLRLRNAAVCRPPLPDDDLVRIARSIAEKTPDFDLIEAAVAQEKREERATSSDIIDIFTLLDLPEPSYVIDEVWPEGGVNVLYGDPGTYKSFLALDWALCRATGTPWFDRAVRQGNVLYVAAEGVFGMGARAEAWFESRGVDAGRAAESFFMKKGAYNLLDDETYGYIRQVILTGDIDLIVYDTLRKSMTGGDENNTVEVGIMMSRLEDLSVELGTDSLLIHHTNRGGSVRGSSAIVGDAYNMWKLRRHQGRTLLTPEKFKDAPDGWELRLTLDSCASSLVVTDVSESENEAEAANTARDALRQDHIRVIELRREGASFREIEEQTGVSRTTIGRILNNEETLAAYDEYVSQVLETDEADGTV